MNNRDLNTGDVVISYTATSQITSVTPNQQREIFMVTGLDGVVNFFDQRTSSAIMTFKPSESASHTWAMKVTSKCLYRHAGRVTTNRFSVVGGTAALMNLI